MRVTDAWWEKRNIGVETQEITCEEADTADSLKEGLSGLTAGYQVLRVPAGRADLLFAAQENGFLLVEDLAKLEIDVDKLVIPAYSERLLANMTTGPATEEEINRILTDVREGKVFQTDRISTDPTFSKAIADIRFYNWMEDLIQAGAAFVVARYKEKAVAFGINKPVDERLYDAVLGGMCPDAGVTGVGFSGIYANTMSVKEQGGARAVTRVSSNNLPMIRLHLTMGYQLQEFTYVLVRHVNI